MEKEKFTITQHELDKDWFYLFFKNKTICQSIVLGVLAGVLLFIWQRSIYLVLKELWRQLGWFA